MAYIYRFKDIRGNVIYVGYTGQTLDQRISQHFTKGHLPKQCYNSVARIEYIRYKTKSDAMIMETYFINKYKPIYNKLNKQNDAITLELDAKEEWKTYRIYQNEVEYKPISPLKGCLLNLGVIGFLLYAIYNFFISIF